MNTIYTLTKEGRPVMTTESLDHATAWRLTDKHNDYKELPHYDSENLGVTRKGEEILLDGIDPDNFLAEIKPDFYNDEGYIGYNRIMIDFFGCEIDLDKCNFTDTLVREINSEVDRFRDLKQEEHKEEDGCDYYDDYADNY